MQLLAKWGWRKLYLPPDQCRKRSNIVTDLSKLESKISTNSRKLRNLNTEISRLGSRISGLRSELTELNLRLRSQRSALSDQLRAAYAVGRQQQLKMLLNQQNPAELARVKVYFDYLNKARQQQITLFLQTIEDRKTVEQSLATSLDNQTRAFQQQKQQKSLLEKQRFQRSRLLANLDIAIHNQERTLTDLESSRSRIENLLMSLGELLADIPPNPDDKLSFAKQKGKLPWPVSGPFLAKYGMDNSASYSCLLALRFLLNLLG